MGFRHPLVAKLPAILVRSLCVNVVFRNCLVGGDCSSFSLFRCETAGQELVSDIWQKTPIHICKRDLYVWCLAKETDLHIQKRRLCVIVDKCEAKYLQHDTLAKSFGTKETYWYMQTRPVCICKRDWIMQKRPIYICKQDLFICAKETYMCDIWLLWGKNLQKETFSKSVGTKECQQHKNGATWERVNCCYPISDGDDKVRAILE